MSAPTTNRAVETPCALPGTGEAAVGALEIVRTVNSCVVCGEPVLEPPARRGRRANRHRACRRLRSHVQAAIAAVGGGEVARRLVLAEFNRALPVPRDGRGRFRAGG